MNNSVFGKIIENVRKHRNINLVTTEKRRNYFVSESNFILQCFSQKSEMLLNKPHYLGLSIL